METRIGVVLVAGGSGKRMGAPLPKQFLKIESKSVLEHCIWHWIHILPQAEYVVVMHTDFIAEAENILEPYREKCSIHIIAGGAERFHSVQIGLQYMQHSCTCNRVAIHDVVRPIVREQAILAGLHSLEQHAASVPVIDMVDSMRVLDNSGHYIHTPRNAYVRVQTPQWFHFNAILEAYQQAYNPQFTDCASVYEQYFGTTVHTFQGDEYTFKITQPLDLALAEILLKNL